MDPSGHIVVLRKDGSDGAVCDWRSQKCIFGNGEDSDIHVNLPSVAKQHCTLEALPSGRIRLTHHSNPGFVTMVDGYNVAAPTYLEHGSIIGIGNINFRFLYPDKSPWIHSKTPSKPTDRNFARDITRQSVSKFPSVAPKTTLAQLKSTKLSKSQIKTLQDKKINLATTATSTPSQKAATPSVLKRVISTPRTPLGTKERYAPTPPRPQKTPLNIRVSRYHSASKVNSAKPSSLLRHPLRRKSSSPYAGNRKKNVSTHQPLKGFQIDYRKPSSEITQNKATVSPSSNQRSSRPVTSINQSSKRSPPVSNTKISVSPAYRPSIVSTSSNPTNKFRQRHSSSFTDLSSITSPRSTSRTNSKQTPELFHTAIGDDTSILADSPTFYSRRNSTGRNSSTCAGHASVFNSTVATSVSPGQSCFMTPSKSFNAKSAKKFDVISRTNRMPRSEKRASSSSLKTPNLKRVKLIAPATIANIRKSALKTPLYRTFSSKGVKFGPQLSPEEFDKHLPPSTPIKRGALPTLDLPATSSEVKSPNKTPILPRRSLTNKSRNSSEKSRSKSPEILPTSFASSRSSKITKTRMTKSLSGNRLHKVIIGRASVPLESHQPYYKTKTPLSSKKPNTPIVSNKRHSKIPARYQPSGSDENEIFNITQLLSPRSSKSSRPTTPTRIVSPKHSGKKRSYTASSTEVDTSETGPKLRKTASTSSLSTKSTISTKRSNSVDIPLKHSRSGREIIPSSLIDRKSYEISKTPRKSQSSSVISKQESSVSVTISPSESISSVKITRLSPATSPVKEIDVIETSTSISKGLSNILLKARLSASPVLSSLRQLIKSPKDGQSGHDNGVSSLSKCPDQQQKPPKQQSPKLTGVRKLFIIRKNLSERLSGIANLMDSPIKSSIGGTSKTRDQQEESSTASFLDETTLSDALSNKKSRFSRINKIVTPTRKSTAEVISPVDKCNETSASSSPILESNLQKEVTEPNDHFDKRPARSRKIKDLGPEFIQTMKTEGVKRGRPKRPATSVPSSTIKASSVKSASKTFPAKPSRAKRSKQVEKNKVTPSKISRGKRKVAVVNTIESDAENDSVCGKKSQASLKRGKRKVSLSPSKSVSPAAKRPRDRRIKAASSSKSVTSKHSIVEKLAPKSTPVKKRMRNAETSSELKSKTSFSKSGQNKASFFSDETPVIKRGRQRKIKSPITSSASPVKRVTRSKKR